MSQFTEVSTKRKFRLGTVKRDVDGTEYTYVKAGAAIAANDAVRLAGSALGFDDVRPTSAAGQIVFGASQVAIPLASFGWVATRGKCNAKVVAATAAGSPLVTNATAGTLALADATAIANRPAMALVTGVAAGSAILLV